MRIGMILDKEFPPDPRVENEVATLTESGHDVFLWSLDYAGEAQRTETFGKLNIVRLKLPRIVEKFAILSYSIPLYPLVLRKSLKTFLKSHDLDFIHIHDMQIAGLVIALNRKHSRKIILDLHENRPEIMKSYSHVQGFLGKLLIYPRSWKKLEKKFIAHSHKTIVVTEESKQY